MKEREIETEGRKGKRERKEKERKKERKERRKKESPSTVTASCISKANLEMTALEVATVHINSWHKQRCLQEESL